MARSAPAGFTQYQKDFMKKLDEADTYECRCRADMFQWFLDMSYYAIKKITCRGADAEECEAAYMRTIERMYCKDKTATILSDCLGIMNMALEEELHDFLGPIYMDTSANASMGQFFTPDSVSELITELTFEEDNIETIRKDGYITAAEPTAGMGGCIISACKVLAKRGVDFSRQVVWHATELSATAYKGCYVQLSIAGVNAYVIQGNTLTLEVFDHAVTPMRILHPHRFTKQPTVRTRQRPKNVVMK